MFLHVVICLPSIAQEWISLELAPDHTITKVLEVDHDGFKLIQNLSSIQLTEVTTENGTFTQIEAT